MVKKKKCFHFWYFTNTTHDKISAAHNKCSALKCTNGSVRLANTAPDSYSYTFRVTCQTNKNVSFEPKDTRRPGFASPLLNYKDNLDFRFEDCVGGESFCQSPSCREAGDLLSATDKSNVLQCVFSAPSKYVLPSGFSSASPLPHIQTDSHKASEGQSHCLPEGLCRGKVMTKGKKK